MSGLAISKYSVEAWTVHKDDECANRGKQVRPVVAFALFELIFNASLRFEKVGSYDSEISAKHVNGYRTASIFRAEIVKR